MKRLQRVESAVAATPLRAVVVEAAFQQFCKNGELPDHERIASAVVERALEAGKRMEPSVALDKAVRDLERLLDQIDAGELPPADLRESREELLRAAVHESEVVRKPARAALRMLADAGLDLTEPGVVDDAAVPVAAKPLIENCLAHQLHLRDAAPCVGPPIPVGKELFDQMKRYLLLAKELGLGKVEEPVNPEP